MKTLHIVLLVFLFCFFGCGDKSVGEPGTKKTTNKEVIPLIQLPAYEVLEKIKMINGTVFVSVLINSYSTDTPESERSKTTSILAERLNADQLDLYCTREAHNANYSSSFANAHPDALEKGFLGTYKNGSFKMPTR